MHRLNPQGETIDTGCLQNAKLFIIRSSGIGLHTDLSIFLYRKKGVQGFHDPVDLAAAQHRRSSSSEKDSVDRRACRTYGLHFYFIDQSPGIAFPGLFILRSREEVTITAFFHTEGNVQVQ